MNISHLLQHKHTTLLFKYITYGAAVVVFGYIVYCFARGTNPDSTLLSSMITVVIFSKSLQIFFDTSLKQLKSHCAALGLQATGTHSFEGIWNAYTVSLCIERLDEYGPVTTIRTSAKTSIPFSITRETAIHNASRAVGLKKEITLGEEVFDKRFWITSQNPTQTCALLNAPIRNKILLYDDTVAPFTFEKNTLTYRSHGLLNTRAKLRLILNAQTQILALIDRAHADMHSTVQEHTATSTHPSTHRAL